MCDRVCVGDIIVEAPRSLSYRAKEVRISVSSRDGRRRGPQEGMADQESSFGVWWHEGSRPLRMFLLVCIAMSTPFMWSIVGASDIVAVPDDSLTESIDLLVIF